MAEKPRIIIYGTGERGRQAYVQYRKFANILAFADGDANKWGTELYGIGIIGPEAVVESGCDKVIIASAWAGEIGRLLLDLGVALERIELADDPCRKDDEFVVNEFFDCVLGLPIKDAGGGSGSDDPWIELENGRIFFGHGLDDSPASYVEALIGLADRVDSRIDAATFVMAVDVAARYWREWAWYPEHLLPGAGSNIVEIGAYSGYRSLRFVDFVAGSKGKVLAVELSPENYRLLEKNRDANNLAGHLDVVHAGISSATATMAVRGFGLQQQSLVMREWPEREQLPVVTLDALLQDWCPGQDVDLIDIRVNGAEPQVLEGLCHEKHRVKMLTVATVHEIEGRSSFDLCAEILRQKEFEMLPESVPGRVIFAKLKHHLS